MIGQIIYVNSSFSVAPICYLAAKSFQTASSIIYRISLLNHWIPLIADYTSPDFALFIHCLLPTTTSLLSRQSLLPNIPNHNSQNPTIDHEER